MTERLKNFKDYLAKQNDISPGDKRYVMAFCKKEEYLESLRKYAASIVHCRIVTGYGNVNSGVCLVFPDEDKFKIIKSLLQDKLEKLNINFWDIYITFSRKTEVDYPMQYNYLMNELYAVGPKVVYVFDNSEDTIQKLKEEYVKAGLEEPKQFQFIDIASFVKGDNDADIWKKLLFIPGYVFINDYYEKEEDRHDSTGSSNSSGNASTADGQSAVQS